jgi:uncharacterized phosphosugar-binding protein
MAPRDEPLPASSRYLRTARDVVDRLAGQVNGIETAASWIAGAIGGGGLMVITGTGHSHMVAEEAFYRAGGLVAVCPVLEPSLLLDRGAIKSTQVERLHGLGTIVIDDAGVTPGDVLVVVSNSGRNPVPVEMAVRGREIGCRVVAITSRAHADAVASRHVSGRKLVDVADLVLDNGVPYGDASLSIEGLEGRVGPLSTIAGVALINAVTVRVAELLVAAGTPPQVFSSANLASESPLDPRVVQQARARIRAL